jgi:hypothetical protein
MVEEHSTLAMKAASFSATFVTIYYTTRHHILKAAMFSDRCENLKAHIHHNVHEITQLDHILSQLNPVHNFTLFS